MTQFVATSASQAVRVSSSTTASENLLNRFVAALLRSLSAMAA